MLQEVHHLFPGGSPGKESACNAGDLGSIPGLGRSPGEGKGYPLQYSCLENSMDYTVHGVAKSQTRLSHFHFHLFYQEHCCPFMIQQPFRTTNIWRNPSLLILILPHAFLSFWKGPWKLSTEELMLLNCGVGEDSWESLGLQGDPTSPS